MGEKGEGAEVERRLKDDTDEDDVIKQEIEHAYCEKSFQSYGFGWRHIITLLVFGGCFVLYTLRVNLSVGLVAMVNHTALQKATDLSDDSVRNDVAHYRLCQSDSGNQTAKTMKDGSYVWNEHLQGIILGSFFYGYILTQIPGGFLAGKFGAKWVFGLGTLWTAALTLLTPLAAGLGPFWLIALRCLEGIGEGVTWPAIQALFANWAPPSERSQLPAFAISGSLFGTLVAFILSGLMADSTFLGGWPAVFYVFGIAGCIWFMFWAIFVESSPEKHRWISKEEKNYIVRSIQAEGRHCPNFSKMPWLEIVKSVPLWAAVISHFTYHWSLFVFLTGLPKYFWDVLGLDLKSNGVASALPYLLQGVVQAVSGKAADVMRSRLSISTTVVRKIFDCSGHFLPAVFIVAVGYVDCENSKIALVLLILSVGTSGFCGGGFLFNFLDLAPQYSSVLFGISNALATVPGIIGPSITGAFTEGAVGQKLVYAWRNVFFTAGGLYLFSAIFYFVFAKGEIQPWAKRKNSASYIKGHAKV